jgi:glycosyltransferase involved in cell wall biosynthesis
MSDTPHILYVGAVLPKRSETFVYREVLGLRDAGVSVSVASVHPPEQGLDDPRLDALSHQAVVAYRPGLAGRLKVGVEAFKQSLWRPPRGLFETRPAYWPKYVYQSEAGYALAHRLKDRGITHVHSHMAHVPTTVAMHCAEALGVPFSFTGHAADLFRDRSALKTKLQRAAFVACISHWHRGFYDELVPRPDGEYPVVRCGVDVEHFKPVDAGERKGLLTVGRLVRKKGFDLLIDAMAKLEHHATLTIVGDGPEHDALQQQINRLELGERVALVGAKANREVRAMMQRAQAFVLPCRVAEDGDRDGIPVVLMEAMASGLAVISGDLPTIRELVEHERTGLMVQPGGVNALAIAIDRLASDHSFVSQLAAAGRRRVVDEFSLAVNLGRLRAAFDRAAENAATISKQTAPGSVQAVEG